MSAYQAIWWRQARSDLDVLRLFNNQSVAPCHRLHYLQMAAEKVAKAYFWRTETPPPLGHSAFVRFLRTLGDTPQRDRQRVAELLGFARFQDFQSWARAILPLAYALERLAPNLAEDGPNPEYPWPHRTPAHAPCDYDFAVWRELLHTGHGRRIMKFIRLAIEGFPQYG